MNIDNLITEWANYERNRLESGSGYPNQTILSSIIENPVRGGFGSRWPTGIQYKNLTSDIVKVRLAVDELQESYRSIIWYKFVGQFPMRVIQDDLNISQRTVYNYIAHSKNLICLYLSNN